MDPKLPMVMPIQYVKSQIADLPLLPLLAVVIAECF